MKVPESQLDVRNFQNVFHYLQEYYSIRKNADPLFSFDIWAKELGEKSRTYLHAMILGERPLKESLLEPLLRVLSLDHPQQEYFKNLFHFSRRKSAEHRSLLLCRFRGFELGRALDLYPTTPDAAPWLEQILEREFVRHSDSKTRSTGSRQDLWRRPASNSFYSLPISFLKLSLVAN